MSRQRTAVVGKRRCFDVLLGSGQEDRIGARHAGGAPFVVVDVLVDLRILSLHVQELGVDQHLASTRAGVAPIKRSIPATAAHGSPRWWSRSTGRSSMVWPESEDVVETRAAGREHRDQQEQDDGAIGRGPSQIAVHPPSTGSTVPVTKLLASEARYSSAPSSSWTSPPRPIGVRCRIQRRERSSLEHARLGHLAAEPSGCERIDADALAGPLGRELPRQAHEAALRRRVAGVRDLPHADDPPDGRDVHDRAAAPVRRPSSVPRPGRARRARSGSPRPRGGSRRATARARVRCDRRPRC